LRRHIGGAWGQTGRLPPNPLWQGPENFVKYAKNFQMPVDEAQWSLSLDRACAIHGPAGRDIRWDRQHSLRFDSAPSAD
jgi:hypothetical protein